MSNGGSVHTIDCHYLAPRVAAAYLIVEGGQAAFVENNTTRAVPRLLAALAECGLSEEDVQWIIITHVHLDHAGGTAELLRQCRHATVLAHPRAARHLIDPSRLVSSAREVYGAEAFERLYGRIEPVAADRIRVMEDGERLLFGSRTLTFFNTLGHARHHFCIHDSGTNGVFTGDSFGIAYPHFQGGRVPFLFPSTTPTDFDPAEAERSVRLIRETGAERAYLTHFGEFRDLARGTDQMLAGLDEMEALLHSAAGSAASGAVLQEFCERGVRASLQRSLDLTGLSVSQEDWRLLDMDIEINAMGIAFAAARLRTSSTKTQAQPE